MMDGTGLDLSWRNNLNTAWARVLMVISHVDTTALEVPLTPVTPPGQHPSPRPLPSPCSNQRWPIYVAPLAYHATLYRAVSTASSTGPPE